MVSQPNHKTSGEFEALYKVLNHAQKKAVDSIEGPVMVIAGPGTGKTTILTLRIGNILKRTDTSPDSILALTFTESGAYAMRRKLMEIIGPSAYKVHIHTFHGFAEHIIQQYPDYFPRIIGSKIITDAEQIKIIEKIMRSKSIDLLRPYGDPGYYVKPVLREIQILKRENISPERLKESIERGFSVDTADIDISSSLGHGRASVSSTTLEKLKKRDEKNLELVFIYEKYEEELAKQKFYDFDDMLLELIRVMEADNTFKLILQETYQYILADEHQDANSAQNKILELLADFHDNPNLFIVGDDKQAIYRFQGASLDNFLYFSKKYPNAQVIDLEHNYRSHQLILDASHSLISNNPTIPGHERTKLVSLQVGGRPIFVTEFSKVDDELEYVTQKIVALLQAKEKPEEIAILYRENSHAKRISEVLKAHGIAHRIESDHDILGDIDATKIVILCRAIHDPSNSEALSSALLLSEMNCDPAFVAEACHLATRQRKSLHLIIKNSKKGGEDKGMTIDQSLKTAYMDIVRWSREARVIPFPDFLHKLIGETNMLASIMTAPDSLERLTSLQTFFDRVIKAARSKRTFYIDDFIEHIDIVKNHGIIARRSYVEHIPGVRLMTAHRSKGLEFNYVFIVHTNDGIWGNRRQRSLFSIPVIEHARDQGRIEDERRLFYVALTRAREGIFISYSSSFDDKETIPSQFVAEIDSGSVSFESLKTNKTFDHIFKKFGMPQKKTTSSILTPDFVRSKFISQPLSVTHLNNYLECPWRYFFVNLIRIPQTESRHQMYGTAMHATLRSFFQSYKEGRNMNAKKLVELLRYNLDMQSMSADDREDSFKKGKKALEGYLRAYDGTWNSNFLTEYVVNGVGLAISNASSVFTYTDLVSPELVKGTREGGGVKGKSSDLLRLNLIGKLDKVEFIDDHDVVVVDYKTSRPKSRNEIEGKTRDADGNYKRQLVFYKLLLDNDDKKLRMKYGEIDFVEPNERGKFKKEKFEIIDREVDQLKESILKMAREVLTLSFVNNSCEDRECQYCKLGKILLLDKGIN
jgi:DNA helicase II / ATP-dependent DNA helicase PcrA